MEAISNKTNATWGLFNIPRIKPCNKSNQRLFQSQYWGNLSRHRRNFRTGSPVYATCYARYGGQVKKYKDEVPLFSRYQIEHQIETAYSRIVQLP